MMNKRLLLYSFVVFVISSLFVRLVDIQILRGKSYADLADRNRMYVISDPEQRGVLLDRYSDPLVFNKPVYYKLDSSDSLYSEKTRIERDEALVLMSIDPNLVRVEHEREYRYPKSLSHVIGYIGMVTVDDLLKDSSLYISDKIGKMGLELQMQDYLKGARGFKKFEINAMGEKQHLIAQEVGVAGSSIPTTVDPYLSEVAYQAMESKLGSVIILDGATGEVLSMVSTPTFDLSYFSETFTEIKKEQERVKMIQSFFSHPQKLFFNRAVSGAYPPGSVFKLITALAGLENKKITQDTTILDEGELKIGEYSYANWYFTQFGRKEGEINLQKAISRSNDIFFYKVAEWVGPEKIKEMGQLFGLGKKTGIELQAETEGLLSDPEWKQRVLGERWFLGNTYHMGIGQGDILVSPIQVARMVQAIANKGTLCVPSFISRDFKTGNIQEDTCGEVGVLRENLELITRGMLDACSSGGTGFPFFSYNAQARDRELMSAYDEIEAGAVACKTGTSEFGAADSRGYKKTHGWFVANFGTTQLIKKLSQKLPSNTSTSIGDTPKGIVEASKSAQIVTDDSPKSNKELWVEKVLLHGFPKNLVVVVLVESDEAHPYREGSKDAGLVAKAIFDWMFADVVGVETKVNEIPDYSRE